MQQLFLNGYSHSGGANITLALPHSKWFRHVGKDGLPFIPFVHNQEKKTCPELLISGAVMRKKYMTDHVNPSVVIDGKPLDLPKTLQDILLAHPLPCSQGPLRMPLYSNTVTQEIQDKTLFWHSDSQPCALWVPSVKGVSAWSDHHGEATYKVKDNLEFKLQGAAMTRSTRSMIYTCTLLGCVIECPCNICITTNFECKLQHTRFSGLCIKCNPQCGLHQLKVPHMFDATSDLYTIVTEDMSKYRYAYGYAGIPSSCTACSEDVLQHQIYHLVYHPFCRYCKLEFRPLEMVLEIGIIYEEAVKTVDWVDNKTCEVCLKEFKDKYARVKHIATVHTGQPQKFKCDHCTKSYSNANALKYHIAKKHQESVQKYPCDLCELQFATPATMIRHKKNIHEHVDCDNFEKLTCDICSQVFSSLSSMKRHHRELHFGPKYNIDFDE